jgi:phosphoribosylaminoimidazole (AIR) synthetase
MYRAFNMGIGFAVVVAPDAADRATAMLEAAGERVHVLGRVTDDAERTIRFRPRQLSGKKGRFEPL